MQRYTMFDTFMIDKLKKEMVVWIKVDAIKRQAHSSLLNTIEVTDFKHSFGKFRIPVNAVD